MAPAMVLARRTGAGGIISRKGGITLETEEAVQAAFFGHCTADALGLPVQFQDRKQRQENPVTTMTGYGVFNMPPGTWSDDSSLTFCLAESLCHGFDLDDMARRFVRWLQEGYWSAADQAFDVGGTTRRALDRLARGVSPLESGDRGEDCNGNGSLMRILPLAFFFRSAGLETLFSGVHRVSAITHAHPVSQAACGIYVVMSRKLLEGCSPDVARAETRRICREFYTRSPYEEHLSVLDRVLEPDLERRPRQDIRSGGYVVDTLEAALWCLLRGSSYRDTVLEAVNLGADTDTTGAVTGGLAGLCYGLDAIPPEWMEALVLGPEIKDLCRRFARSLEGYGAVSW